MLQLRSLLDFFSTSKTDPVFFTFDDYVSVLNCCFHIFPSIGTFQFGKPPIIIAKQTASRRTSGKLNREDLSFYSFGYLFFNFFLKFRFFPIFSPTLQPSSSGRGVGPRSSECRWRSSRRSASTTSNASPSSSVHGRYSRLFSTRESAVYDITQSSFVMFNNVIVYLVYYFFQMNFFDFFPPSPTQSSQGVYLCTEKEGGGVVL